MAIAKGILTVTTVPQVALPLITVRLAFVKFLIQIFNPGRAAAGIFHFLINRALLKLISTCSGADSANNTLHATFSGCNGPSNVSIAS